MLQRIAPRVRKVAVLRASRIGDFICATPALRALRHALPGAHITLISLPMLKDLAERLPSVDAYAAFPGFPGLAEQFFEAHRALRFFQEMQKQSFDLAIQMQGSGVYTNPFMLMLGARHTAGYVRPGDGPGRLDAALPLPERGHEIERALALVEFIGAPAHGLQTEFPLRAEDHAIAQALLQDAGRVVIGLHAGARQATRRWPAHYFAAAGGRLAQEFGGTLALLGEAQDRAMLEDVGRLSGAPYRNLAGSATLPVLGALLHRLSVLIANDSGPAHIAYALGTPCVVIFGGADPQRYAPIEALRAASMERTSRLTGGRATIMIHPVGCRPCDDERCPIGYACLEGVSVEAVTAAADQALRSNLG